MKKDTKKKLILAGAAAAAAAIGLPLFAVAPGHATKRQKAPLYGLNYAHRGLHSQDKTIPENSLAAFAAAAEAGYGVELDVQLSKDGRVVVFHDDTLNRVCGVDHRVDELTFDELRELRLCGTDEQIPLFTEVLAVISGRGPIICELKTGRHNRELCKKTYDIIQNYKGDICIESFDPTIVAWFRFHAKDLVRGQLAAPADEYPYSKALNFAISSCMLNFLSRPQFIAYKIGKRPLLVHISEKMGAMVVGWTSHDPASEKKRDAVIFEFYRPRLKYREMKK